MVLPLAFLDALGLQWLLPLAILGILLYGERLPEVAANFGKKWIELRKAAQAVRSEIESVANEAKYGTASRLERTDGSAHEEATAPKFEPPPAEVPDVVTPGASAPESH